MAAILSERGEAARLHRAADSYLTQAAVSQHLRHLETRLCPLLIHRSRGIELIPAGEALLDYCRELEGAQHQLDVRLEDGGMAGDVSLVSPG